MRTICVLAASVAVLAGMMLPSTPARACDDRYPVTCNPTVVEPPDHARPKAHPSPKRKAKASTATRSRAGAGNARSRQSKAAAGAARRVHPRLVGANGRSSRPNPSPPPEQVSASLIQPALATARVPSAVDAVEARHAVEADHPAAVPRPAGDQDHSSLERTVRDDEANRLDRSADPIVIVSHAELNEIDRAAFAPPQLADQAWLAQLLAALGGAFAAASMLRLLTG